MGFKEEKSPASTTVSEMIIPSGKPVLKNAAPLKSSKCVQKWMHPGAACVYKLT